MFDVGFSELMIIALVALIVIGPERLPKVARTAGHLLGRLQRYVNDVKSDINREMQLDELKKMQNDVVTQVRDMEHSVAEQMKVVENDLSQSIAAGIEAKAEIEAAVTDAAPADVTESTTALVEPALAAPVSAPAAEPANLSDKSHA